VIDEVELEVVLHDAFRIQAKNAHLLELKTHAATCGEIAGVVDEDVANVGDRASRVIGCRLDNDSDAMRSVAFVNDLVVVGRILARGALDGGEHVVLGHVHRTRVLHGSSQRRVGCRIGAAGFHGNGYFLTHTRELLRHAVPAREHRVLSDFENAAHGCAR
jgi:hypothetical protein